LIRQKTEVSYNQVQFSATILNLWLTFWLYATE
jgi:hypothetical protein